jgi:hypothetical protein
MIDDAMPLPVRQWRRVRRQRLLEPTEKHLTLCQEFRPAQTRSGGYRHGGKDTGDRGMHARQEERQPETTDSQDRVRQRMATPRKFIPIRRPRKTAPIAKLG